MSDFTIIGRAVTHTARPRFRAIFEPCEADDRTPADTRGSGGTIVCGAATTCGGQTFRAATVDWLDEPPTDPAAISRLMRLAADCLHHRWREDWIMERVIARAGELKLTAYEIAKRTGWAVSEDHVQAFLSRRKSMGSHKLQYVLRVLNLTIEKG